MCIILYFSAFPVYARTCNCLLLRIFTDALGTQPASGVTWPTARAGEYSLPAHHIVHRFWNPSISTAR